MIQVYVNNYDPGSVLHELLLQHIPYELNTWPGPNHTIFLVENGVVKVTFPLDGTVNVLDIMDVLNKAEIEVVSNTETPQ